MAEQNGQCVENNVLSLYKFAGSVSPYRYYFYSQSEGWIFDIGRAYNEKNLERWGSISQINNILPTKEISIGIGSTCIISNKGAVTPNPSQVSSDYNGYNSRFLIELKDIEICNSCFNVDGKYLLDSQTGENISPLGFDSIKIDKVDGKLNLVLSTSYRDNNGKWAYSSGLEEVFPYAENDTLKTSNLRIYTVKDKTFCFDNIGNKMRRQSSSMSSHSSNSQSSKFVSKKDGIKYRFKKYPPYGNRIYSDGKTNTNGSSSQSSSQSSGGKNSLVLDYNDTSIIIEIFPEKTRKRCYGNGSSVSSSKSSKKTLYKNAIYRLCPDQCPAYKKFPDSWYEKKRVKIVESFLNIPFDYEFDFNGQVNNFTTFAQVNQGPYSQSFLWDNNFIQASGSDVSGNNPMGWWPTISRPDPATYTFQYSCGGPNYISQKTISLNNTPTLISLLLGNPFWGSPVLTYASQRAVQDSPCATLSPCSPKTLWSVIIPFANTSAFNNICFSDWGLSYIKYTDCRCPSDPTGTYILNTPQNNIRPYTSFSSIPNTITVVPIDESGNAITPSLQVYSPTLGTYTTDLNFDFPSTILRNASLDETQSNRGVLCFYLDSVTVSDVPIEPPTVDAAISIPTQEEFSSCQECIDSLCSPPDGENGSSSSSKSSSSLSNSSSNSSTKCSPKYTKCDKDNNPKCYTGQKSSSMSSSNSSNCCDEKSVMNILGYFKTVGGLKLVFFKGKFSLKLDSMPLKCGIKIDNDIQTDNSSQSNSSSKCGEKLYLDKNDPIYNSLLKDNFYTDKAANRVIGSGGQAILYPYINYPGKLTEEELDKVFDNNNFDSRGVFTEYQGVNNVSYSFLKNNFNNQNITPRYDVSSALNNLYNRMQSNTNYSGLYPDIDMAEFGNILSTCNTLRVIGKSTFTIDVVDEKNVFNYPVKIDGNKLKFDGFVPIRIFDITDEKLNISEEDLIKDEWENISGKDIPIISDKFVLQWSGDYKADPDKPRSVSKYLYDNFNFDKNSIYKNINREMSTDISNKERPYDGSQESYISHFIGSNNLSDSYVYVPSEFSGMGNEEILYVTGTFASRKHYRQIINVYTSICNDRPYDYSNKYADFIKDTQPIHHIEAYNFVCRPMMLAQANGEKRMVHPWRMSELLTNIYYLHKKWFKLDENDTDAPYGSSNSESVKEKAFYSADDIGIKIFYIDKFGNFTSETLLKKEDVIDQEWYSKYLKTNCLEGIDLDNELTLNTQDIYNKKRYFTLLFTSGMLFDLNNNTNIQNTDHEKIPYTRGFAEAIMNCSKYDPNEHSTSGSLKSGIGLILPDLIDESVQIVEYDSDGKVERINDLSFAEFEPMAVGEVKSIVRNNDSFDIGTSSNPESFIYTYNQHRAYTTGLFRNISIKKFDDCDMEKWTKSLKDKFLEHYPNMEIVYSIPTYGKGRPFLIGDGTFVNNLPPGEYEITGLYSNYISSDCAGIFMGRNSESPFTFMVKRDKKFVHLGGTMTIEYSNANPVITSPIEYTIKANNIVFYPIAQFVDSNITGVKFITRINPINSENFNSNTRVYLESFGVDRADYNKFDGYDFENLDKIGIYYKNGVEYLDMFGIKEPNGSLNTVMNSTRDIGLVTYPELNNNAIGFNYIKNSNKSYNDLSISQEINYEIYPKTYVDSLYDYSENIILGRISENNSSVFNYKNTKHGIREDSDIYNYRGYLVNTVDGAYSLKRFEFADAFYKANKIYSSNGRFYIESYQDENQSNDRIRLIKFKTNSNKQGLSSQSSCSSISSMSSSRSSNGEAFNNKSIRKCAPKLYVHTTPNPDLYCMDINRKFFKDNNNKLNPTYNERLIKRLEGSPLTSLFDDETINQVPNYYLYNNFTIRLNYSKGDIRIIDSKKNIPRHLEIESIIMLKNNFFRKYNIHSTRHGACFDSNNAFFIFYEDHGNISIAKTSNFGETWFKFDGILKLNTGEYVSDPQVIKPEYGNYCYLFFKINNRYLCCKQILLDLTSQEDAFKNYYPQIYKKESKNDYGLEDFSMQGRMLRDTPINVIIGLYAKDSDLDISYENKIYDKRVLSGKNGRIFSKTENANLKQDIRNLIYTVYQDKYGKGVILYSLDNNHMNIATSSNFINWEIKKSDILITHKDSDIIYNIKTISSKKYRENNISQLEGQVFTNIDNIYNGNNSHLSISNNILSKNGLTSIKSVYNSNKDIFNLIYVFNSKIYVREFSSELLFKTLGIQLSSSWTDLTDDELADVNLPLDKWKEYNYRNNILLSNKSKNTPIVISDNGINKLIDGYFTSTEFFKVFYFDNSIRVATINNVNKVITRFYNN